jgi:formylglycine-generating enzyme required for sulfatase activity
MILTLKLKIALTAATLAGPLAFPAMVPVFEIENGFHLSDAEMVALPPVTFGYRLPGEFTRGGRPADAPVETVRISRVAMMKRQVTAGEYARCVADRACPALAKDAANLPDRPAVRVSWRDAEAYAAWLSEKTGETYRLPSDEEWVFAAASRFRDDSLPETVGPDPSRRWIARYEQESKRELAIERDPQPIGTYGVNEHGLLDMAGNIWEWTSTCYRRVALDKDGVTTVNCGVRVVEGQHRSYMTDFIRDPRSGGCAAGKPPSNLGFRLVRDEGLWQMVRRHVRWLGA